MVDRHSGWPSGHYFAKTTATSKGLVDGLRGWFKIFGVTDELSLDGQSTYTSQVTKDFLKAWKVRHRLSLAYFPHSNTSAELGVKATVILLCRGWGCPQLKLFLAENYVIQCHSSQERGQCTQSE